VIVADTNVLVRLLVDDDAAQADRAEAMLRAGPVRLLLTVLLELAWVLRASYRLPRPRVLAILRGLVALPMVEVEDPDRVARALDWFEAGLDFTDALHLAAAAEDQAFVTFDQDLVRRAGRLDLPCPVGEP
jgi:predicted nucleic-acid-binding protein